MDCPLSPRLVPNLSLLSLPKVPPSQCVGAKTKQIKAASEMHGIYPKWKAAIHKKGIALARENTVHSLTGGSFLLSSARSLSMHRLQPLRTAVPPTSARIVLQRRGKALLVSLPPCQLPGGVWMLHVVTPSIWKDAGFASKSIGRLQAMS